MADVEGTISITPRTFRRVRSPIPGQTTIEVNQEINKILKDVDSQINIELQNQVSSEPSTSQQISPKPSTSEQSFPVENNKIELQTEESKVNSNESENKVIIEDTPKNVEEEEDEELIMIRNAYNNTNEEDNSDLIQTCEQMLDNGTLLKFTHSTVHKPGYVPLTLTSSSIETDEPQNHPQTKIIFQENSHHNRIHDIQPQKKVHFPDSLPNIKDDSNSDNEIQQFDDNFESEDGESYEVSIEAAKDIAAKISLYRYINANPKDASEVKALLKGANSQTLRILASAFSKLQNKNLQMMLNPVQSIATVMYAITKEIPGIEVTDIRNLLEKIIQTQEYSLYSVLMLDDCTDTPCHPDNIDIKRLGIALASRVGGAVVKHVSSVISKRKNRFKPY